MKTLIMVLAFVGGMTVTAHAEETMGEKAKATANDAGRAMKKGAHRAQEAVCMKSDTKCMAEKAKHRGQEAGDAIGDKASEVKNAIDSDKK